MYSAKIAITFPRHAAGEQVWVTLGDACEHVSKNLSLFIGQQVSQDSFDLRPALLVDAPNATTSVAGHEQGALLVFSDTRISREILILNAGNSGVNNHRTHVFRQRHGTVIQLRAGLYRIHIGVPGWDTVAVTSGVGGRYGLLGGGE